MTTAFTICANNYLAHAKTLAVSFKKHHPEIDFVLAILDTPNKAINYDALGADKVLWVTDVFPELVEKLRNVYSIAEFCTVIKPELFKYFFESGSKTVLYIDPDIKVFSKFEEVFSGLKQADVILTPHICSPTPEIGHPQDKDLMRTGIYNLGFLAMNKTNETLSFVDWWDKRVKKYGFHDLKKGYFYDQIWLGYAPAFLDKVFVLRHSGYNMANWNLHERNLLLIDENYFVNDEQTPLCFFHYSHFKMEALPILASYNENFTLDNRPDIVPIYMEYKKDLQTNNYKTLKEIDYAFGKKKPVSISLPLKSETPGRLNTSWGLFKKMMRILLKGR